MQVYLGSFYVNNFNEFGRTWQVNIQADQSFRERGRDIRQLKVRNNRGEMIRLATLMTIRGTSGSRHGHAVQHVLGHVDHRQRRAGNQLGTGHCA